jgi:hypothetical protein
MKGTPIVQDDSILGHIDRLVGEERRLREKPDPGDDALKKLAQLAVELDQYWDLLRQRRARREFGEDPEQAAVRDAGTVERYIG